MAVEFATAVQTERGGRDPRVLSDLEPAVISETIDSVVEDAAYGHRESPKELRQTYGTGGFDRPRADGLDPLDNALCCRLAPTA